MRCNKCGYENSSEARTCVYCGEILSGQPVMGYGDYKSRSIYGDGELKRTRLQTDRTQQEALLKKTVVQGGTWEGNEKRTSIQPTCPRCHYPMIGDYCANCGYETHQASASTIKDDIVNQLTCKCQNCGKDVSFSFRYCPDCGTEIEKPTINPFCKNADNSSELSKHQFTLTLLNESEEGLRDGETKEYCGDNVMLNRDNTEPVNQTISKEQAELTFEANGWTLLNRSGYGSTMVTANRKIQLESGDIILLGNRRFRFETK